MDVQTEAKLAMIMWQVANTCDLPNDELALLCWAAGMPFPPQAPIKDEVAYELRERQRLDWMDKQSEIGK